MRGHWGWHWTSRGLEAGLQAAPQLNQRTHLLTVRLGVSPAKREH